MKHLREKGVYGAGGWIGQDSSNEEKIKETKSRIEQKFAIHCSLLETHIFGHI